LETFHYELGVNSDEALNFFFTALKEETEGLRVRTDDTLYIASVLAHFAQTSCYTVDNCLPSPRNPADVIEQFYLKQGELLNDASLFELGGSQSLLFGGFFREQVRRRHNVRVLDALGESLYWRASSLSRSRVHREMFTRVSLSFRDWAIICRNLNKTFEQNQPVPHLLKFD
jgi:hypothetical protein